MFLASQQLLVMDVVRASRRVTLLQLAGSGNVWEVVVAG
jgi:hypothetical protein